MNIKGPPSPPPPPSTFLSFTHYYKMNNSLPTRRLNACERCRTRKSKCDSLLPSCASCKKAGVECVNKDRATGRAYTRDYVNSLEHRLKAIEQSENESSTLWNDADATKVDPTDDSDPDILDDSSEPIDNLKEHENSVIANLARHFLMKNTATITAYNYYLLSQLAKRYFRWINGPLPVLHESVFSFQLENCYHHPQNASISDWFQVKMVIAIALASIARPSSDLSNLAHGFWKSAHKPDDRDGGLQALQNILLESHYTLLVPKAGNLFRVFAAAFPLIIEMGLYSACPTRMDNLDSLTLDLHTRLFWTWYCIDRMLTMVTGRVKTIADPDISTRMPITFHDSFITLHGIRSGPNCQLKMAQMILISLCRLQSEISDNLYSSTPPHALAYWSWSMYDKLRSWRAALSYSTAMVTHDWMNLQFNTSVVFLFRPSPHRLCPSIQALHVALHSATEVIRLTHAMYHDLVALFPRIAMQNLFMSGIVLVGSASKLPNHPCAVNIYSHVQTCTVMLERLLPALEPGANDWMVTAFKNASSSIPQGHRTTNPAGNCIWSHIAQAQYPASMPLPSPIDGCSIPLQINRPFLPHYRFFQSSHDHYYAHDIASSSSPESLNRSDFIPTTIARSFPVSIFAPIPDIEKLNAELDRWFLYPYLKEYFYI